MVGGKQEGGEIKNLKKNRFFLGLNLSFGRCQRLSKRSGNRAVSGENVTKCPHFHTSFLSLPSVSSPRDRRRFYLPFFSIAVFSPAYTPTEKSRIYSIPPPPTDPLNSKCANPVIYRGIRYLFLFSVRNSLFLFSIPKGFSSLP